jgi:RNA polymerase sigma-70 factor, ECF subfamily
MRVADTAAEPANSATRVIRPLSLLWGPYASIGYGRTSNQVDRRWDPLYAQHRGSLYRAAAVLVGDGEAEEVVQEAFERAMKQADFFDQVREPSAWLRRVVVRLAISRLRRRAILDRALTLLGSRAAVEDHEGVDVEWALRRLPATQRGAVVLRYYFRADYPEIAAALGLSEASVSKILNRARAALRRDLG